MESVSFENICSKISSIHNNKIPTELEYLEELFVMFVKMLFMRVFDVNREPIVKIVNNLNCKGSYDGYITFKIYREQLKKFQSGHALDLFETICHELCHFTQKRGYEEINIKNSVIEKDNYLKKKIDNYYDTNYDFLMQEVDVFLSQRNDALDILNALGIIPSEEELAKSKELHDYYKKNIMITNRFAGSDYSDVSDLYEKFLTEDSLNLDEFEKNNYLEYNPCAKLEYKIVDGIFVKRNIEEIEELYNNWQNGILKLQGKPNEITVYFKYTIDKLKSYNQELKPDSI